MSAKLIHINDNKITINGKTVSRSKFKAMAQYWTGADMAEYFGIST